MSSDSYTSTMGAQNDTLDNNGLARRRISKACNYCRQRKIKCNGEMPCSNCDNHSIECVYTKTMTKKKRVPVKKLTIQDVEKKVTIMESKLDTLNEVLSSILTVLNEKRLTNIKPPHVSHNSSSSVSLIDEAEGYSSEEDEDEEVPPLSPMSDTSVRPQDQQMMTPPGNNVFSNSNAALDHIGGFNSVVNPLSQQFTLSSATEQLDMFDAKLQMNFYAITEMQAPDDQLPMF